MKRSLLSTAALALMSSAGLAADLPIYEPPPAMVSPAPMASNWSGFYIGVHGGYGWADVNADVDGGVFDLDDSELEGPGPGWSTARRQGDNRPSASVGWAGGAAGGGSP